MLIFLELNNYLFGRLGLDLLVKVLYLDHYSDLNRQYCRKKLRYLIN